MMFLMVTSYSLSRAMVTITKSPFGPRMTIVTALMPLGGLNVSLLNDSFRAHELKPQMGSIMLSAENLANHALTKTNL